MTRDKFNETGFGPKMFAEYRGGIYPIVAVAFDEGLLALKGVVHGSDDPSWVRCENIEIVPNARPVRTDGPPRDSGTHEAVVGRSEDA